MVTGAAAHQPCGSLYNFGIGASHAPPLWSGRGVGGIITLFPVTCTFGPSFFSPNRVTFLGWKVNGWMTFLVVLAGPSVRVTGGCVEIHGPSGWLVDDTNMWQMDPK